MKTLSVADLLLLEDYTMTAIVLSIATEPDLDGLQ